SGWGKASHSMLAQILAIMPAGSPRSLTTSYASSQERLRQWYSKPIFTHARYAMRRYIAAHWDLAKGLVSWMWFPRKILARAPSGNAVERVNSASCGVTISYLRLPEVMHTLRLSKLTWRVAKLKLCRV